MISAQAVRIQRVEQEMVESLPVALHPVQPAVKGADPEIAPAIFKQALDRIVGDTGAVGRIGHINGHRITVILVQPVFGAEPHKSTPVLQNGVNGVLGEAVLDGQVFEVQIRLLTRQGNHEVE